MTFSRIIRFHLNYKFLKTTVKNPKINTNKYKFMRHLFIKTIVRSLNFGLKILFIDETGFKLDNANYYQWRKKKDIISGGGKEELKKQINMILAIDNEKILYNMITDDSINHNNFIAFLNDLINKVGRNNIKNYIIVMDNAKCHIDKEVRKFALDNKLKIIANCPYYSVFNAIEYVFLNIKTKLYKKLFKNRKELKQEIKNILNDENLSKTIEKIYLSELKIYRDYINENKDDDIEEIYRTI